MDQRQPRIGHLGPRSETAGDRLEVGQRLAVARAVDGRCTHREPRSRSAGDHLLRRALARGIGRELRLAGGQRRQKQEPGFGSERRQAPCRRG
jgi:hypothetical protein